MKAAGLQFIFITSSTRYVRGNSSATLLLYISCIILYTSIMSPRNRLYMSKYVNLIVINVLSIAQFHWKFACESSFTQFRQRDRYPCFHRTFLVFIMLLVSARGGFSYRRGVRRNWWRGVSTSVPFPVPPLFYPFPSLPLPRPVASEEQREQCSPKLKLPPP